MQEKYPAELASFMNEWTQDPLNVKTAFRSYLDLLLENHNISFQIKYRPGISYSVRAANAAQTDRDFFVLLDVVDDDPAERWLSVCFYADMVADPSGLGDRVPAGLGGLDAVCFNLDEDDTEMRDYIGERIREASLNPSH